MQYVRNVTVLAVTLVFCLSASSALAVQGGDRLLTCLPNGLRVCIIKDTRFPLVATRLYVRTGSANEELRLAGISHLLEHMVFKGTDHRPKGQISHEVEALGGYLNAATSFDKTWYITDMPAEHWRTGMDVIKEMAFQASLDPKELEAEKEVVISELERDQDSPGHRLFEALQTSTLCHTPYGRPIIGFKESIRAVTTEDLRSYVRRWYQPQNMMLLVAGDIDPQAVLEHATSLFGGMVNTHDFPAPAAVDLQSAPGGSRVEVVRGPWNKVYLGMAFPAPALTDMRSVALDVLCYVLGGDSSSVFPQAYMYDKRLVDDIDMGNMSLARGGMLSLTATLAPEQLKEFWDSLTLRLAGMKTVDFKPEALARARYNLEDSMDRSAETLVGLASWAGAVQFDMGGERAEHNLRYTQRHVDEAQVREAIELWLQPSRVRVRVLAPEKVELPDLEAILQKNWPSTAPTEQAAQSSAQGQRERVDLGNGRTVVLIPDDTVPYVALKFMQPGGNALLQPQQQGLAELTARTLTEGCDTMDAPALGRYLSDRAASLEARAGVQTFTVSLSGPSRFGADFLTLFDKILGKARLEEKDVRREAEDVMADIRQRADRPTSLLFSRLGPFLYPGGQVYGYDPLGTETNSRAFTAGDVRSFWKKQLSQPWTLAVAGDFDREAVLAFAKSLPVPENTSFRLVPPVWGKDRTMDLHAPGRNQAHVLQAFKAVPLTHPDASAFSLLQAVLAGQSGLLFTKLRDDQGLGYAVTAMYTGMAESGRMAFYIGTTPDKVEQARQGFAGIIAELASKPLSAEKLKAAANSLLGHYLRGRQSLSARAGEAATEITLGLPEGFEKSLVDQAARLSPEELLTVVRKYLKREDRYDLTLLP
ncbi:MAG: insulinase family protein [Desulfovibrio sp.]|nr:insulinase family protein [Desulfovibrio sp.]